MNEPPLDEWAKDGALRELARLARDLPHVDADEAARRLARLTPEQRALVVSAVEELGEPPPAG